jgi:hypothetical protein
MKRLAIAIALVAVGACQKAEQKPAAAPAAADTSHAMMPMSDTSKMKMQMPMADTAKKAMAPAAPAAKPAAKKKKP